MSDPSLEPRRTGRMWHAESGQAFTEYALVLALVGVVAVVALSVLGSHLTGAFGTIGAALGVASGEGVARPGMPGGAGWPAIGPQALFALGAFAAFAGILTYVGTQGGGRRG